MGLILALYSMFVLLFDSLVAWALDLYPGSGSVLLRPEVIYSSVEMMHGIQLPDVVRSSTARHV